MHRLTPRHNLHANPATACLTTRRRIGLWQTVPLYAPNSPQATSPESRAPCRERVVTRVQLSSRNNLSQGVATQIGLSPMDDRPQQRRISGHQVERGQRNCRGRATRSNQQRRPGFYMASDTPRLAGGPGYARSSVRATQAPSFERLDFDAIKKNAAVVAWLVYEAANSGTPLARKAHLHPPH